MESHWTHSFFFFLLPLSKKSLLSKESTLFGGIFDEIFDEIKVELASVKEKIQFLVQKLKKMNNEMLRLNSIKYDDCKVAFFT